MLIFFLLTTRMLRNTFFLTMVNDNVSYTLQLSKRRFNDALLFLNELHASFPRVTLALYHKT